METHTELRQRVVEILMTPTLGLRPRRSIVRQARDDPFVVLRVPDGGRNERCPLRLGQIGDARQAVWHRHAAMLAVASAVIRDLFLEPSWRR